MTATREVNTGGTTEYSVRMLNFTGERTQEEPSGGLSRSLTGEGRVRRKRVLTTGVWLPARQGLSSKNWAEGLL